VLGATLTGVIGLFVVVACAATLHASNIAVDSAADAARALEPLAGSFASGLFGIGLIGAALLAASVLPLSSAYSICEFVGTDDAIDDRFREARLFYVAYAVVTAMGVAIVLVPGAPLIAILVVSQAINAILLLPLLALMGRMARDPDLMGEHRAGNAASAVYLLAIGFISLCIGTLGVLAVTT